MSRHGKTFRRVKVFGHGYMPGNRGMMFAKTILRKRKTPSQQISRTAETVQPKTRRKSSNVL